MTMTRVIGAAALAGAALLVGPADVIADLLRELSVSVSPVAIRKAAGWFQEVLR